MRVRKYDVVVVDLNPRKRHVQLGVRPCVVVQSNLLNAGSSTLMVVPLTTVDKKVFPSEFWITPSEVNGLKKASRFLGSQLTAVDRGCVGKILGRLEFHYREDVRMAIDVALDWEDSF